MSKREKRWIAVLYLVLAVLAVTSFVRAASVEYGTKTVLAEPGIGIWTLWEAYGYGDYHKWKHDVMEMNGLDSAALMEYQRLMIPIVIEN